MSEVEARRELVRQWLEKAEEDLSAATALLHHDPPLLNIVCFHAQQCAEKMLKAFLQYRDFRFSKTHDLVQLRQWCEQFDASLQEIKLACHILLPYGVEPRYPGMVVTEREVAEEASRACEQVYDFVVARLRGFVS